MPHFTQSLKKELSFYGFEPVNLVTGSVLYEGIDFFFLGALPLEWKRVYHSDSNFVHWHWCNESFCFAP